MNALDIPTENILDGAHMPHSLSPRATLNPVRRKFKNENVKYNGCLYIQSIPTERGGQTGVHDKRRRNIGVCLSIALLPPEPQSVEHCTGCVGLLGRVEQR